MPGMVRDSNALSKLWDTSKKSAKEKNIRAVIQNHYLGLDQFADGTRCL
jgi:hypothetical protein